MMVEVATKLLLFIGAWILKANGQVSSVVSPTTIMTGDQYTLTCDMSKIPTQRNVISVSSLTIYRLTADVPTFTLAQYISNPPPDISIKNTSSFSPGLSSTWNFTFVGANGGSSNKDTMRIIVNVQNSQCNDAAAFICSATYYYSGQGNSGVLESFNSTQQNLTVEAGTTIDPIKVDPAKMGDVTGDYVYIDGDNITLTCTVRGPVGVTLSWELYIKDTIGGNDQQTSMPPNAQVTSPPGTPTGSSGSCSTYTYVSTLMIQLVAQTEPNIFVCVAKRSSAELARANVTISTSGSGTPAPQTSEPASADVGMIVGIVIGCVALIAIIIVVIFVVRYRRNKSRGDTYKGNEDQRDAAGDNNFSAPPPVVYPYSKPTKGNKEKDDHKAQEDHKRHQDLNYDDYEVDKQSTRPYGRHSRYDDQYDQPKPPGGLKDKRGRQTKPNHDKRQPQEEQHYASTDVSQSGDESADHSDVPLEHPKPRPKRRSQAPREGRDNPKQLHYAELDLSARKGGSEAGSDFGRRQVDIPVQYAEIRV